MLNKYEWNPIIRTQKADLKNGTGVLPAVWGLESSLEKRGDEPKIVTGSNKGKHPPLLSPNSLPCFRFPALPDRDVTEKALVLME